ncbi:hypothetical protein AB0K12_42180 [Nonomuraea sp. NPDC049419]|uniref:hypothetical protein n=1 Tax=Nonomuraea sp. NPDC049419 TaxID=3155772 RepID=UPI0034308FFF
MKKTITAVLAGGALLLTASPALAETAGPTLGPYGYGTVKLGMSAAKARATGKIVIKRRAGAFGCAGYDLRASPTGRNNVGVYVSKRVGVAVILARKGMRTPRGIGLGSTMMQVKRAYPGLRTAPSGFRFVTVPGNPRAYYAFLQSKGKVRQLVLALDRQDCVN